MSSSAAASPADAPPDVASLEQATVAACAVAEECTVDGWLLRFSPGKAKRARSIQAMAAGAWPLDEKLRDAKARYEAAGLPALVRITPQSEPAGLDDALAVRAWRRFDESLVMARRLTEGDGAAAAGAPGSTRLAETDGATHAAWVGAQRGSSASEIAGHAARLAFSPVAYRALHLSEGDGHPLAGGQLAVDGDGFAGLYDVHVDRAHRRAGHARMLCRSLVARAAAGGARVAYLQVDAGNAAAIALYRTLGFAEAYRYHYREAPGPAGA